MRKTKGLYRRGNVYWMSYKDNRDVIQRESTGKTLLDDAEYILLCRRKEIKEGKLPDIKKTNYKFAELARKYDTLVEIDKGYRSKKPSFGN